MYVCVARVSLTRQRERQRQDGATRAVVQKKGKIIRIVLEVASGMAEMSWIIGD